MYNTDTMKTSTSKSTIGNSSTIRFIGDEAEPSMRESLLAVDAWMVSKRAVDHNGLVLAEAGAETNAGQVRRGLGASSRRLGLEARHRRAALDSCHCQSARFLKRVGGNLEAEVERARRGGKKSRLCVLFDRCEVDDRPLELHVPIELMHL